MLGSIAGDIIGSRHEFNPIKTVDFELFASGCRPTDDTICTLAVASAQMNNLTLDHNLEQTLVEWVLAYVDAGYGLHFLEWALKPQREPYNSWGNGAAMRVGSLAYLSNSMEHAMELAAWSASVTHNHHHGIRAAKAVVGATRMALEGFSRPEIRLMLEKKFGYNVCMDPNIIRNGYVFEVASHKSVPQALSCFFAANSWEECVRLCVSLGGDADTQACIAGGVAQAYFGLPENIKNQTLPYLDERMLAVYQQFEKLTVNKIYERSNYEQAIVRDHAPVENSHDYFNNEIVQREMEKIGRLQANAQQMDKRSNQSTKNLFDRIKTIVGIK